MALKTKKGSEVWAGRVCCQDCGYEYIVGIPWGRVTTADCECPKCGSTDAEKIFNCAEEAATRIITALADVLGVPEKAALAMMRLTIPSLLQKGDIRRMWWGDMMTSLKADFEDKATLYKNYYRNWKGGNNVAFPGPGDQETWPPYYGHPNDPRDEDCEDEGEDDNLDYDIDY